MRVSRWLVAITMVGFSLGMDPSSARADLTVTGWRLGSFAQGNSPTASQSSSIVANPFSETQNPTVLGAQSTTVYDFGWDVSGGSFSWNLDHETSGALNGLAESFGTLSASVTGANMLYDLSGSYALAGEVHIVGHVQLTDTTTGNPEFKWAQQSDAVANESFVVGRGGDGTSTDFLQGAPSGVLLAGHTYQLTYAFVIVDFIGTGVAATAVGGLNLTISSATVVPTPGALALGLMGLPVVGWLKRRLAQT